MSDETISQVTKAIRTLILNRLTAPWRINPGLPGTKPQVTLLSPGEDPPSSSVGVNLYMYRLNESAFLRNMPYPGDRSGQVPPNPESPLSLELFYLLTPYAPQPAPADVEDSAHRMLGQAMLVLHEHPILNRIHTPDFDSDVVLAPDLLDSYEDIKVRLNPISIDELSKIWSTIGKPYRLSVAYEVTLVQLTPTKPAAQSGGIVETTKVDVITKDPPRITSLQPATGPLASLVAGVVTPTPFTIRGFGFVLSGMTPSVVVGGSTAGLSSPPAQTQLNAAMPLTVAGGPDVDIIVRLDGLSGLPATYRVRPWVSSTTPLRTALDTTLPRDLAVRLDGTGLTGAADLRGNLGGTIWSTSLTAVAGADAVTANLPAGADSNASVTGLTNGLHEIRVQMPDGSLSNPRYLEVLPQLNGTSGYATNSGYNAGTKQLTLAGRRLDGIDVRLNVDGVEFDTGANTTGTQLVYPFVRGLTTGSHSVAVNVDGRQSRGIVVNV